MKLALTMLVALLTSSCVFSQKYAELPKFGEVEKSELELKECLFDKNAPAMYIFREAESLARLNMTAASSSVLQQMEVHIRIKIFNKEGLKYANVKIKYPDASGLVTIKKLSAQTYNLDEAGNIIVTKLDKANVFEKKINKRWSEKTFAMPDVKEGSVIEYKYTVDGDYDDTWYFQQSIPVKFSRLILSLPVEVITSPVASVSMPMKKGQLSETSNNVKWFEMENLPGLRDEPFMSCEKDYLQRIEVRPIALEIMGVPRINLIKQWPERIRLLLKDEDFGEQLKKDIPRTADLDDQLRSVTEPFKKMQLIHRYVRNNMMWNNYDNIWALNGVKSAWKDKKGTSGEINLILVNLLKDAGLNAHAILVSSSDNGAVNTSLPVLDQFNKVMAYVEIDDKYYVLDAVEKNTPTYLIPLEVMASEGLMIAKPEKAEWGWRTLWDNDHKNSREVQLICDVDNKGMIHGAAEIKYSDYARVELLPTIKKGETAIKEKLISSQNMTIDSFSVANLDDEGLPIIESVNFSMPAPSTGDYNYFSVNLFAGLDKNPLIADNRQSDIFYGTRQEYLINAAFTLPDGFKMDDLPKNVRMITPDTSIAFSRRASYSDGILSVLIKLEIKLPFYPVADYEIYKEFYKKMYGMLNDKFVYKKG